MLEFKDFYRMRKYCSVNWRGNFSEEEIAEQAHDDYCEYERLVGGGIATANDALPYTLAGLKEDVECGEHSKEVLNWISELEKYFEVEVG